MQKITRFFNFFRKNKIKTYKDFINSIILPFTSTILFMSFMVRFQNIFLENKLNNVQFFLIVIMIVFIFIWPITKFIIKLIFKLFGKEVFKNKKKSNLRFFYNTILLHLILFKNPLIFLIFIIPIIAKDSYLYISVLEKVNKSIYYIYFKEKIEEDILNEN